LYVVAVLVGEHVRLGERSAPGAEARTELLKEPEVDVDVLVDRTVERPRVGAGRAAPRVGRAREEDGLGDGVAPSAARELTLPVALDAVDIRDDPAILEPVRLCPASALVPKRLRRRLRGDRLLVELGERPREPAPLPASTETIR